MAIRREKKGRGRSVAETIVHTTDFYNSNWSRSKVTHDDDRARRLRRRSSYNIALLRNLDGVSRARVGVERRWRVQRSVIGRRRRRRNRYARRRLRGRFGKQFVRDGNRKKKTRCVMTETLHNIIFYYNYCRCCRRRGVFIFFSFFCSVIIALTDLIL